MATKMLLGSIKPGELWHQTLVTNWVHECSDPNRASIIRFYIERRAGTDWAEVTLAKHTLRPWSFSVRERGNIQVDFVGNLNATLTVKNRW